VTIIVGGLLVNINISVQWLLETTTDPDSHQRDSEIHNHGSQKMKDLVFEISRTSSALFEELEQMVFYKFK
jgi:hypothetical protein